MKNAPVMDFWVSTSIFLSSQLKSAVSNEGKLLHDQVSKRDIPSRPVAQNFEIRHPALKRPILIAR